MATSVEVTPKLDIETRLFINGEFVDSIDGGRIPVVNPHDGSVLCEISEAGTKDVDRAVVAAHKAFPAWKKMLASERGRLIFKLADAIEADREYLSVLETLDTGHPIRDTQNLDVARTVATFRYMAGIADKIDGRVVQVDPGFHNYVLREPVGVVGSIVPWNFPMMFVSWKLAPALAAGN
ncbi:MAG TPA: aldehyde dehydrogenase family protein, partial [Bryobacteraceae bacterium]|nr:aldehyde dehydrogenase family protein [Bryobacteraceae bacterium]